MGYNDPDIIFEDGDFKHLDTTIHMTLLFLYVTQAFVYYDFEKMGSVNKVLFKAFLNICAQRLAIKVTHMFGSIWRVVYGGMPSGAYETSHGDSWVVAFVYFLFVASVIKRNPHRASQINALYALRRCGIVVYGDDHILFTHKSVYDIINEKAFANFVKKHFNMLIRDIHAAPFITTVNDSTGCIVTPGVVFLKRYFVNRENVFSPAEIVLYNITSTVLPYRPLNAIIQKFAYGKGSCKSNIEYIVSAIGMAYDTQGTNRVAYEFCKLMYIRMSVEFFGSIQDELRKFIDELMRSEKDTFVTRLCRTLSMSPNDLVAGFPTWEDLASRHSYDMAAVDFGPQGHEAEEELW